jgi:hypothetical protein
MAIGCVMNQSHPESEIDRTACGSGCTPQKSCSVDLGGSMGAALLPRFAPVLHPTLENAVATLVVASRAWLGK